MGIEFNFAIWAETPAIQHNKTQWHIRQEEMPRTLAPNAGWRAEQRRDQGEIKLFHKNIGVDF